MDETPAATEHRQSDQDGIARLADGGAFLRRDGELLRPAQNCEWRYGGSTVLWEVQELTPTTYRKTEARELTADKAFGIWNQGVNTLN